MLDLVRARSGTVHKNGGPSAEKTSAPGANRDARSPSRDSKNAIDDQLQDATSVLDAFHIVKLAAGGAAEQTPPAPRGRKG